MLHWRASTVGLAYNFIGLLSHMKKAYAQRYEKVLMR
jgi:hypothetical protein